jgi:hypothetical protein
MAEGWVVHFRYSIYSLNWYKSTNTDAEGVSIARRRERR